ncbi:MAG: UPF0182 family protein [Gemmatimonadaceae bacterium]
MAPRTGSAGPGVRPGRWLILGLAGAALVLLAGRGLASIYIDRLWYSAMGAADLWRVQTLTTAALLSASAVVGALFVFANLLAVRRSVVSLVLPRRVGDIEIGEEIPGRYLTWTVIAISVLFGLLLTIWQEGWTSAWIAFHGLPFGETDPFFEADLAFFVYWLPFERSLYFWSLIAVLAVTALVVFLYALTPSLRWERGTLHVSRYVRRHLTVLGGLLLLVLAWSYRLDTFSVLVDGSGTAGLFTPADHAVSIPGNQILSWLTACVAVLVVVFGWLGQTRAAFVSVTVIIVLSLVTRELAPLLASRLSPPGSPITRVSDYEDTRAGYSRRAFGIELLETTDSELAYDGLRDAVRHVPAWDPEALLRAIESAADGALTGPRVGWQLSPMGLIALVPERLRRPDAASPDGGVEWTVHRILASEASAFGAPVPAVDSGDPDAGQIVLPSSLVADSMSGYVIIADTLGVVPAPALTGGLSRLAHAWSLQNFRLLLGELPPRRPEMLRLRDVRERVAALAPFFVQGSGVLPVLVADSLYWTVELYSASSSFPLALDLEIVGSDYSYFRHAATAIVSAATGRVAILPAASLDPIARSWIRRFPMLFASASDIPAALLAVLPPVLDAARVQATIFARFGQRGDTVRARHLPRESGADSALARGADPLIGLGETVGARWLAWTVPVLDASDLVIGTVVALGGGQAFEGAQRGVFWMPIAAPHVEWQNALDRLRLQSDSGRVIPGDPGAARGAVRSVPVSAGVALVQPAYAWPAGGSPTLAQVSALYGDEARTGATLSAAVGLGIDAATPSYPAESDDDRAGLRRLYQSMKSALARGDWAAFGAAFDSLGAFLAPAP